MHTTSSLLKYCIPPFSSQALITLLLSTHYVLLCPESLLLDAALVGFSWLLAGLLAWLKR